MAVAGFRTFVYRYIAITRGLISSSAGAVQFHRLLQTPCSNGRNVTIIFFCSLILSSKLLYAGIIDFIIKLIRSNSGFRLLHETKCSLSQVSAFWAHNFRWSLMVCLNLDWMILWTNAVFVRRMWTQCAVVHLFRSGKWELENWNQVSEN